MIVGPIFVREAMTAPRRLRHYLARSLYAAMLFVLMWTAWQSMVGFQRVESAGDVARFGGVLFRIFSLVQLALALFFAPIVAGSSISAEKDRRTFVLLLMTRLTNWEIIMGKLLASLLQMGVLLATSVPVFAMCLLLGGASMEQVLWVFGVTAAAALASGSLGILIASWREKTFQSVALTVLIIVLYLVAAEATCARLGQRDFAGLSGDAWGALVSPFRAVVAVLDPLAAGSSGWWPGLTSIASHLGMPASAAPPAVFLALMLLVTMILIGVSIAMLRVWNPGGGKPTHARGAIEELERRLAAEGRAQPKTEPRTIWDNPVLWREIRTRAYGHRPLIVKLAYLVTFAMICLGFFVGSADSPQTGRLEIARLVVPIVVTSLILINVQAVTSITSERDGRALDLLLVTDITPKEFIFGKILGVVYNTKEMIVPPLLLCVYLYLFRRQLLGPERVSLEVWIYVIVGILVLISFAITLGLHAALAYEKTRSAVVNSLGTIAFLFIGILLCIYLMLFSGTGRFLEQLAAFVVFVCAGALGMYVSLAVRNQSAALALVSFLCPWMTWYGIAHFLQGGDPLGSFLTMTFSYGFAVTAMLVPAVSEFDVALGRTVAEEG